MLEAYAVSEIKLLEDADLVRRLKLKLDEYQARAKRYQDENQTPEPQPHLLYRMIILQQLLENGVVEREKIREVIRRRKGQLSESDFYESFGVIWAYANKRFDALSGGTGLPR